MPKKKTFADGIPNERCDEARNELWAYSEDDLEEGLTRELTIASCANHHDIQTLRNEIDELKSILGTAGLVGEETDGTDP